MTSRPVHRMTAVVRVCWSRRPSRWHLRLGVAAAWVSYTLMAPVAATAQDAVMSTTVAPLGSGSATSRLNLDAVKPRPATYRGLALPSFSLTDDGGGPRVKSLMLQMPDFDLGGSRSHPVLATNGSRLFFATPRWRARHWHRLRAG